MPYDINSVVHFDSRSIEDQKVAENPGFVMVAKDGSPTGPKSSEPTALDYQKLSLLYQCGGTTPAHNQRPVLPVEAPKTWQTRPRACLNTFELRGSGTIEPYLNDRGHYFTFENCAWILRTTRRGLRIRATVDSIDIENDCVRDFIAFHDGQNEHAPKLGQICGKVSGSRFESSGGVLFVQFVTDVRGSATGFRINFEEITPAGPLNSNPATCDFDKVPCQWELDCVPPTCWLFGGYIPGVTEDRTANQAPLSGYMGLTALRPTNVNTTVTMRSANIKPMTDLTEEVCVSFWYRFANEVRGEIGYLVLSANSSSGDVLTAWDSRWDENRVDVRLAYNQWQNVMFDARGEFFNRGSVYWLTFSAQVYFNSRGGIAVDDFMLARGPCEQPQPTNPTTETSKRTRRTTLRTTVSIFDTTEPELATTIEPEIPTTMEPEIPTTMEPEIPTTMESGIPTTMEPEIDTTMVPTVDPGNGAQFDSCSSIELSCDFANGLCGWYNNILATALWTGGRRGARAYIEAKSSADGPRKYHLETCNPVRQNQYDCFAFSYTMNGKYEGTLNVVASTDTGSNLVLFTAIGSKDANSRAVSISLKNLDDLSTLSIIADVPGFDGGDIILENFNFHAGSCFNENRDNNPMPTTTPVFTSQFRPPANVQQTTPAHETYINGSSCNFEPQYDTPDCINSIGLNRFIVQLGKWNVVNARNSSGFITEDHTTGTASGNFLLAESSLGKYALVASRTFRRDEVTCVSLWYSIGNGGVLKVVQASNGRTKTIMTKGDTVSGGWRKAVFFVENYRNQPYRLRFIAFSNRRDSYVAIDDITLKTKCDDSFIGVQGLLAQRDRNFDCPFDNDSCEWNQQRGDWRIFNGERPIENQLDLPDENFLTISDGGALKEEVISLRSMGNVIGRLESEIVRPTQRIRCFSFFFKINGWFRGQLSTEIKVHVESANRHELRRNIAAISKRFSDDSSDRWYQSMVSILEDRPFRIIIEVLSGDVYSAHVALDAFSITSGDGDCQVA